MSFCGVCGTQLLEVPSDTANSADSVESTHDPNNTSTAVPPDECVGHAEDVGPMVEKARSPMRKLGLIAVATLAIFAIVAGGFWAFGHFADKKTVKRIELASRTCGVTRNVSDNGATITFDTKGEEEVTGDSYEDVDCVLTLLLVPTHVTSKINGTRALDGTLTATWDRFEAFWSYHPDKGMRLTIHENI